MGKILLISVLILIIGGRGFAQEKVDSLKISDTPPSLFINPFSVEHSFDINFPLSDPGFENQLMLDQVFKMEKPRIHVYSLYQYPTGFVYKYSKGGYSFLQNTHPLQMNLQYSFGKEFGWNKFDLFFDMNAAMVNRYNVAGFEELMAPNGQRMLMWDAAVGVSYEIRPNVDLFLRTRSVFVGKQYYGQMNEGGVKMKF